MIFKDIPISIIILIIVAIPLAIVGIKAFYIMLRISLNDKYLGLMIPYKLWKSIYSVTQNSWKLGFFCPQYYEYMLPWGYYCAPTKLPKLDDQSYARFHTHIYFQEPFSWFRYFHERLWGIIGVPKEYDDATAYTELGKALQDLTAYCSKLSDIPVTNEYSVYYGMYCVIQSKINKLADKLL